MGCVLQRLQELEAVDLKQLDLALLEVQNGSYCAGRGRRHRLPSGGYSCSRKVHKCSGSEEWPNWSLTSSLRWCRRQQLSEDVRISSDVVSNGGLEVCSLLPDVLCTGEIGIASKMLHEVGHEDVATSLVGVFPEERCMVGNDDDNHLGVYVGHERVRKLETRWCFQGFWKRARTQTSCVGWYCEKEGWRTGVTNLGQVPLGPIFFYLGQSYSGQPTQASPCLGQANPQHSPCCVKASPAEGRRCST